MNENKMTSLQRSCSEESIQDDTRAGHSEEEQLNLNEEDQASVENPFTQPIRHPPTFFDMHRQNIRALSLIVCTFTYLMIGAAIFDALESDVYNKHRHLVDEMKDYMQKKYNFSKDDYRVLEHIVIKAIPHKAGYQWRFAGAFYFATVVITTVGYGHSTPATKRGKAFCILYALAGIPLNLVMFQSIGERVNTFICYVLTKVRHWLRLEDCEVSMTHMILVSSTLGSMVVVIGTYLFNKYERWGYFDSFYYCFITLTTIGFGDYVAMQKGDMLQNKPEYVVFSLLFILFGMAIFAASVNLFVLRFMATSSDGDSVDKDPVKTIVLKGLSQSDEDLTTPNGSIIFSSRSGPRGSIKESVALRPGPKSPPKIYLSPPSPQRPWLCRCLQCFDLFDPKRHYSVRRAPTRIGHLLQQSSTVKADGPSEAESILLQEFKRRRHPSM